MTGPGIDPEVLAAFLRGELTEQEAEEVARTIDEDHSAQELARTLFRPDEQVQSLLQDILPLSAVTHEPELQSTLAKLRELGRTLTEQTREDAPQRSAELPQHTDGENPKTRIGDYEILALLDSGGMGTVYRARHIYLQREFAVKVVASHRQENAQALARFQREVAISGRLQHKHLVQSVSAGEHEHRPFLVMELLHGKDVGLIARERGCLAIADACEIVRQAAVGVSYLAANGFVHRDIKPSNLMVATDREELATSAGEPSVLVKILDLGLAGETDKEIPAAAVTQSHQILGSLDYVAPEQALDSRRVDTRADVYSLGCTLYRLLSGYAPFDQPGMQSAIAKLFAHHQRQPVSLAILRPDLPSALRLIVERAMEKKPGRRFATAQDLAAALSSFCPGANIAALLREPTVSDVRSPVSIAINSGTGILTIRSGLTAFFLAALLVVVVFSIWIKYGTLEMRREEPAVAESWSVITESALTKEQTETARNLGVPVAFTNSIGMSFQFIPKGEQIRKIPDTEQSGSSPFYMGVHEVSLGEFQRILKRQPKAFSGSGESQTLPVRGVSWTEAIHFCRRLSDLPEERKAGRWYTLPTQAEWEWACRAGQSDDLPWPLSEVRNHVVVHEPAPLPSGTYSANAFGLFDLHGNVAEWAADWTVYGQRDHTPRPPSDSHYKAGVLCGGSYESARPELVGAAARMLHLPDQGPKPDFGFRVVCRLRSHLRPVDELPDKVERGFDPMTTQDQSMRGWGFPGGEVANRHGEVEQFAGSGSGGGSIWYGRHGNLNDFDLRFEFKIDEPDLEFLLFYRADFLEKGWERGSGYRLFLAGPKAGLLYQEEPGHSGVVDVLSADVLARTRFDTWNQLVLRCEGRRTRLWLNSELALDFHDPAAGICLRGPLSFLTTGSKEGPRRAARFRNLRIKLLGHPLKEDLTALPWTMGSESLPAITMP